MCVLNPPQSRRGKGYVIRRAREEDLTQVMEVNYRSLPENYWYGFFKYILERWRRRRPHPWVGGSRA